MAFNSFLFVAFAGLAITFYNLVPARFRKAYLVAASLAFYAASSLTNLGILVIIVISTYLAAFVVHTRRTAAYLSASIVAVLFPLLIFKYAGFIAQLVGAVPGGGTERIGEAVLPVGMSFFTFQAIGYLVDVFRGTAPVERRLVSFALFIAFFPKLLAGPIERARDLLPQLDVLAPSVGSNVYVGLKWVLWGFFCKLVIADNLGSVIDAGLRAPQEQSAATLWVIFALYSFQIYFDFLGYTNIALGVARCFNIRLNRNFNAPYAASSIREFWRRWHISLSTWFRDYVYMPLGGRTTRGAARLGQILVVFLASGLWHGAALNFVAWGAFHGTAYWIEERFRMLTRGAPFRRPASLGLQSVARVALTFLVVTVGWVFFRLSDASNIRVALARMTFLNTDVPHFVMNAALTRVDTLWFVLILTTGVLLDASRGFHAALERLPDSPRDVIGDLAYVNWLLVTLVLLGDLGVRDFTYFQF
jgi:D-alanyl-lipoteichoic acid acyltransferase DltB (MBOAT superfamily)